MPLNDQAVSQQAFELLKAKIGDAAKRHEEPIRDFGEILGKYTLRAATGGDVALLETVIESSMAHLKSIGVTVSANIVIEVIDELGGWLLRVATAGLRGMLGLPT